jgi:hypothetical protein
MVPALPELLPGLAPLLSLILNLSLPMKTITGLRSNNIYCGQDIYECTVYKKAAPRLGFILDQTHILICLVEVMFLLKKSTTMQVFPNLGYLYFLLFEVNYIKTNRTTQHIESNPDPTSKIPDRGKRSATLKRQLSSYYE